jgi:hypothetical protein
MDNDCIKHLSSIYKDIQRSIQASTIAQAGNPRSVANFEEYLPPTKSPVASSLQVGWFAKVLAKGIQEGWDGQKLNDPRLQVWLPPILPELMVGVMVPFLHGYLEGQWRTLCMNSLVSMMLTRVKYYNACWVGIENKSLITNMLVLRNQYCIFTTMTGLASPPVQTQTSKLDPMMKATCLPFE